MLHGHPNSYDDAILESGNRRAKDSKKLLFWGGTDELDPDRDLEKDPNRRIAYSQQRTTGTYDENGNVQFKIVHREANKGIERQLLENTFLRQTFDMQRNRGGASKSKKRGSHEELKSNLFKKQCDYNGEALQRIHDLVAAADELDDDGMDQTA